MKTILVFFVGLVLGAVSGFFAGSLRTPTAHIAEPRNVTAEWTEIVQSGDTDAILEMLDGLRTEGYAISGSYWVAFKPRNISGADCAALIEQKYNETSEPFVRAKLISILGANGSPEATALICKLAEAENHVDILVNVAVALERSHPTRQSLQVLQSMKGDTRIPLRGAYGRLIGQAPDGTGTPLERWAEKSHHRVRIALQLSMSDPEAAW